jgi:hypothetical protein
VDFDFRFKNSEGKWKSVGHSRGTDRAAAFRALAGDPMPPGRYMSRPRGRQRHWDVFSLDQDGIITAERSYRKLHRL